ncbi:MAG: hypothetical protein HYX79_01300 [Chloroflexi bacterium]|nr:hypothetical protein [Chloroflexota bacterium]
MADIVILTQNEIQQKIETLKEPGSTVFFYLGAGPSGGGPLGRGAAVVELNPGYPAKKQKKYNIYTAAVEGTETTGKGQKLWDSDKTKDIAKWIKERHYLPSSK